MEDLGEDRLDSPPAKRRRASRAGQAKRFECKHPGCEKRYSRFEHLQRHELNHVPRKIYRCERPQCGLTFVRPDLFQRHKARHDGGTSSTLPRIEVTGSHLDADDVQRSKEVEASQIRDGETGLPVATATSSEQDGSRVALSPPDEPSGGKPDRNATTQLTHFSSSATSGAAASIVAGGANSPSASWQTSAQTNDNFAAWLFESPNSHDGGFSLDSGLFLDFGLENSPKDFWNLADLGIEPMSPKETTKGKVSEERRREITSMLGQFLAKQRAQVSNYAHDHVLFVLDHTLPNLAADVLDRFISNYWLNVSVQMSIIHQPTFSSNTCHLLLLLAIISLGAADLVKCQPKGRLADYKELSDLIATHLRWEIFTDDDAEPPVQLWVAQTLLLLEFYEKQWSTRRLHERAHIHHASTLTLLRRGSPLVGRSEEETPPIEVASKFRDPVEGRNGTRAFVHAADTWWAHWVRNESFNRVVFSALFMDTLHAVMYGHAADMAPYEIRTALPCDDYLWTANSSDEVQRLDANLKMYGIRSITFLDGLKQSLHAQNVQTHSGARMLLMAGLLSICWHVNRREKHLQFLETMPSTREQGRWRSLLLNSFGHWRKSFDDAIGVRSNVAGSTSQDTDAATVLFHLAHMTMHADIIDCQIFSGSTRLLGRKVSKSDFLNVVQRIKAWSHGPFALHAVLHSSQLLYKTLVKPSASRYATQGEEDHHGTGWQTYSCRNDRLILRPWSVYLATLILWAYQHASASSITMASSGLNYVEALDDQAMCCQYLTACAAIDDPRRLSQVLSMEGGIASVLNVVSQDLANAEPELLVEASLRLQTCRSMLANPTFAWPAD